MSGAVSSVKDVRKIAPAEYGFIMNDEYPLDVLVSSRDNRRPASSLQPHMWTSKFPRGSFRQVADDLFVSTPEFVYVQLAAFLDHVELSRLALELCGTYRLSRYEHFAGNCPQLSSATKLSNFAGRATGVRGSKKGLQALRWVADGSASPQETIMMLALCLPQRCGGYGLAVPELNPSIPVSSRMRPYVEGDVYSPDCLWKRKVSGHTIRVTAEYDSDECHGTPEDAERTRIRRNAFKTLGYLVTSINRLQMKTAFDFQYPARQIARDLGLYRRELGISDLSYRDDLLRQLRNETVF